jgi:TetR/AcrR family transcriptional regulator, lmrAB and yxaGH operons repressor
MTDRRPKKPAKPPVKRAKRPPEPARREPEPEKTVAAPARERTPRERMVIAAAALLSERGLAGTSFSEVIERSGAPRGSIYHHFPEGKDSLTAEAIGLVGDRVLKVLRLRDSASPQAVVQRFIEGFRTVLVKSEYRSGCAIGAVGLERLEHPQLGALAGGVFVVWERELHAALVAAGMIEPKATSAAGLVLAALEGALILCRARREIGPLDTVGAALTAFVSD